MASGREYLEYVLIKPVKTAVDMLPDAQYEIPYEGAKEMILVDSEDKVFLKELVQKMSQDLPVLKKRRSCYD